VINIISTEVNHFVVTFLAAGEGEESGGGSRGIIGRGSGRGARGGSREGRDSSGTIRGQLSKLLSLTS
jgi:hypothetical protein